MAYLDTKSMTNARLWSIGIVLVLHAALLYALVTGTYKEVIERVTSLTTYDVPIVAPPLPAEPVPVPLPKQSDAPAQVVVPKARVETPASSSIEVFTTPLAPPVFNDAPSGPVVTPIPPAPPVAVVPEPSAVATRARQRGGSISDDDYPPAAVRAEEQGRSTATYTVDASGRVSSCSAAGAGPILDVETCKLIQRRFRFTAAQNASGSPIAETKTQSIEWRLPR